jgi:hypothetical protein
MEIQVQILTDNLSIHECDAAIRHNFPHLIDHWLATLPRHFTKWLRNLCSRENMRYRGTIGDSKDIDIYRLRSLDLHPTLQTNGDPCFPGNPRTQRIQEPPFLHLAKTSLITQLTKHASPLQETRLPRQPPSTHTHICPSHLPHTSSAKRSNPTSTISRSRSRTI